MTLDLRKSQQGSQPAVWSAPRMPKLRTDLMVRKVSHTDGEICELKVPGSNSICLLYAFELRLAKKMDGKRDLPTLVEAGKKLGLPLNMEQLEKFVRQLACYRFIENAEPVPGMASSAAMSSTAPTLESTLVSSDTVQAIIAEERRRAFEEDEDEEDEPALLGRTVANPRATQAMLRKEKKRVPSNDEDRTVVEPLLMQTPLEAAKRNESSARKRVDALLAKQSVLAAVQGESPESKVAARLASLSERSRAEPAPSLLRDVAEQKPSEPNWANSPIPAPSAAEARPHSAVEPLQQIDAVLLNATPPEVREQKARRGRWLVFGLTLLGLGAAASSYFHVF